MAHLPAYTIREMEQRARRYALAECSDPFAFDRAMAHMKQGVARLGDYDAQFNKVHERVLGPRGFVERVVHVPHSVKRA